MSVQTILPNPQPSPATLTSLKTVLGYAWGCRSLILENTAGVPTATVVGRHPDSLVLSAGAGLVELHRIVAWRRLDRDDVAHAARLAIGTILCAPGLRDIPGLTLTAAVSDGLETALQGTVKQAGAFYEAGVFGLVHAAHVSAAGFDASRTSVLRLRLPSAGIAPV